MEAQQLNPVEVAYQQLKANQEAVKTCERTLQALKLKEQRSADHLARVRREQVGQ